ncbi:MAG: hypothetical protein WC708_14820 [Lentisphaeria bacterium]
MGNPGRCNTIAGLKAAMAAAFLAAVPVPAASLPAGDAYLRQLEKWYVAAAPWIHDVPGRPGVSYYGTGGHEHWAVQANGTAFAAVAVLATAPELNEKAVGTSRDDLRRQALRMLRYLLQTHVSGSAVCVSGKPWGASWISALALERLAHGVAALRPWLTPADQDALRGVMIRECDYLLDGYPVVAAIDAATGHNKPESNIWNGALLYRTALLYPDAANAEKYRRQATRLFLNGISIPADATDTTLCQGQPVKAWHVGPNFTPAYGLNHHGYLNVGYMEICLSNLAMLHFFCQDYGLPVPPELDHHAADLWRLVKILTFDDGRLWRIGGDTRVRYCYCQDYALPGWFLALDRMRDPDAAVFIAGWLKLVATEQGANADGGFLSGRLAELARVSPLYYCRLEGDRAVTLSMAAYWQRRFPGLAAAPAAPASHPRLTAWTDAFHGAVLVRGPRRLASWVWKASQGPAGTLVPADRSDLAEWQWNLAGKIEGAGCDNSATAQRWWLHSFPGGFATCGSYAWVSRQNPAEGTEPEPTANAWAAMVALPDDASVVVLQQARAAKPVYINRSLALYLNIPNDVYNGGNRSYGFGGRTHRLAGAGNSRLPAPELIPCGNRLSVDGQLQAATLAAGDELALYRPGRREVNLAHCVPLAFAGVAGSLYCDVVCLQPELAQRFYQAGDLLFNTGATVSLAAEVAGGMRPESTPDVRIAEVTAADRRRYRIAANFGAADYPLAVGSGDLILCGGPITAGRQLILPPNGVAVLQLP